MGAETSRPSLRLAFSAMLSTVAVFFFFHETGRSAECAPPPLGLVSWWPGDGTALDIGSTNDGALSAGTTYAPGLVGLAFAFDGTTNTGVVISNSAALNPSGPFSVEAWIKADPQQPGGQFMIVDKSHGAVVPSTGWLLQGDQYGKVSFGFGDGSNNEGPPAFPVVTTLSSVQDNQWHHLIGMFTGTQLQIFLDGVRHETLGLAITPPANNRDVEIGRWWGGGTPARNFHGLIDEVSFYGRALSAEEITALYSSGAAGKCKLWISRQPQSRVAYWGQTVTFSVILTNLVPSMASYQWEKNGMPVVAATNATLVLTNLQASDAGSYFVNITNGAGNTVTSTTANLTVNPAGVSFALYGGVTIDGVVGLTYGIQYTTDLSNTNSWKGVANVTLGVPSQLWFDVQPASQPQRYYRVLTGPISIP